MGRQQNHHRYLLIRSIIVTNDVFFPLSNVAVGAKKGGRNTLGISTSRFFCCCSPLKSWVACNYRDGYPDTVWSLEQEFVRYTQGKQSLNIPSLLLRFCFLLLVWLCSRERGIYQMGWGDNYYRYCTKVLETCHRFLDLLILGMLNRRADHHMWLPLLSIISFSVIS